MRDGEIEERLAAGCEILREAGRRALDFFRRRHELAVERKGRQDLVSRADREVEALIRERLGRRFPEDAVIGEEQGGVPGERMWITDPIDGTANFLRGIPYWSMTLAFLHRGRPLIGLTYDPLHDELFAALAGGGARRDGRSIRVSAAVRPEDACVGLSFSFRTPATDYARVLETLLVAGFDHRRMGSAALSLAHVADGRLDAAFALRINSWDVLSGLLLVREAGGVATAFAGDLLASRSAAAATPGVAEAIAAATGIPLPGGPPGQEAAIRPPSSRA